jgi:hypothetical protein
VLSAGATLVKGKRMCATSQPQATTRAFARVLGPFFFIVPATIAVRAPELTDIAADFAEHPIWPWVLGALLLFGGLIIIGFHQHWRSPSAIAISLLGWFLGLRGLVLLTMPQLITHGATVSMNAVPLVQLGFGTFSLLGLWLSYVGWIAKLKSSL